MLTGGSDGGFKMHTNPRGVEEGPISGIWSSNKFSEFPTESLDGSLDDDEYGTKFEIILDTSIESSQVEEWVDKYGVWSRVPVLFQHHDEEGNVKDEEYIPEKIIDKYKKIEKGEKEPEDYNRQISSRSKELKYVYIENPYFDIVVSNLRGSNGKYQKVVSLDTPIEYKLFTKITTQLSIFQKNRILLPYKNIELRFKSETSVVVEGPNKGSYVVSEPEADDLGDDYISEKDLTEDDIVTPSPTGTRDVLKGGEEFIHLLSDLVHEKYYEELSATIQKVTNIDEYLDLNDEERDKFHDTLDKISKRGTNISSFSNTIEERTGVNFNEGFHNVLEDLHNGMLSIAPENKIGIARKENREYYSLRSILLKTKNKNKQVYFDHRLSQESAEFVWDSNCDAYVAQVNSEKHDIYRNVFGWEKLSNLNFETDLEMDDSVRKKYTSEEIEFEEELITIHLDSYSTKKTLKVKELYKYLDNNELIEMENGSKNNILELVLFKKRSGDEKISENKDLVGNNIATSCVRNDIYEQLIDHNNIVSASEALDKSSYIRASDGHEYNIAAKLPDNVVTHLVKDEEIEIFRNPENMKKIQDWISSPDSKGPSNAVYLPYTLYEKDYADFDEMSFIEWVIDTETKYSGFKSLNINSTTELYMKAIYGIEDEISEAISSVTIDLSEGGDELIKLYEKNN